jgi:uncharacterized protein
LTFFLLVFPFLMIGAVTGIQVLPGLPVTALMAVCLATAAPILVQWDDEDAGTKALLKRAFGRAAASFLSLGCGD